MHRPQSYVTVDSTFLPFIFVVVQRVEEIMTLVHQEQRMTLFDVVEPMSESEGAGAVGSVIKTVVCNPVDGYWFLLTMKSFSGLN